LSGIGTESMSLNRGIYLIQFTFSDGAQATRKLIKN
jgi:hypothetical protein